MYGMTEEEFWHGDMRSLSARRKAYFRNAHYMAWLFGSYGNVGSEIAIANSFAKKGANRIAYIDFKDPIEKKERPKITKENIEVEFRKQQAKQQMWLHDLLNKG